MKQTITIATLAFALVAPAAEAAKIRFEGPATYTLATKIKYRAKSPSQGGRYESTGLGRGYYHSGRIGMRWIDNRSAKKSNLLSFEFWALPYIGATSGPVLSAATLKRINGYGSLYNVRTKSYTLFIDRYRFPDINIWERGKKTEEGWNWNFRDAFTFSYKEYL